MTAITQATPAAPPRRVPVLLRQARGFFAALAGAVLGALAGLAGLQPAAAQGDPAGATVLVLDASGSMRDPSSLRRPDGTPVPRHEVATTVVEAILAAAGARVATRPDAPPPVLGFVRFGHQIHDRQGSPGYARRCEDVESLERPQPLTDALRRRIAFDSGSGRRLSREPEGWYPKGETPIVRALGEAARLLQPAGGNIVIVTDLITSQCPADPCDAGLAPSERLPANVTVRFVVATGLGGRANDQAERLARCLKAEFRDPQSPAEAIRIGNEMVTALFSRPQARIDLRFEPEPLLPADFTLGDLNLRLRASDNRAGTWDIAVPSASVLIAGIGAGSYTARFVEPAGRGLVPFSFAVQDPMPPARTIVLPPARLTLTARDAQGRPVNGAVTWRITDQRGRAIPGVPAQAVNEVLLAPGAFRISAVAREIEGPARDITLRFDERAALTFDFDIDRALRRGTLLLGVRDATGRPVAADLAFRVEPVEGGEADSAAPAARERVLAEGRYQVTPVVAGTALAPLDVTIEPDRRVSVTAQLEPPLLRVSLRDADGTPIAPADAAFDVLRQREGGGEEVLFEGRGPALDIATRAGRHRIQVQVGDRIGSDEVEMPAFGTVERAITVR